MCLCIVCDWQYLVGCSEINKGISHSGRDVKGVLIKSNIQKVQFTLKGYQSNLWIVCTADTQSHFIFVFFFLCKEWEVFQFCAKQKLTKLYETIWYSYSDFFQASFCIGVFHLAKPLVAFSLPQTQGLDPNAVKQVSYSLYGQLSVISFWWIHSHFNGAFLEPCVQ